MKWCPYLTMVKLFSFVFFYFLFIGSCSQSDENSDLVLARVGSQKLYFKDLPENMVSPNVSKNKISFFVDKNASKDEIKFAIEKIFEVKVSKINTLISKGKSKVFKGTKGKRKDTKKAIIKYFLYNKWKKI